jgi:putative chitinase
LDFKTALFKLWPHGDQHIPNLREGIADTSQAVFQEFGIDSNLEIAVMMGEFSEECGCGLEMVENLNYSAQGLLKTWPSHFTPAMAQKYAYNPRMIADIAYGGRMGNAPPPSDQGYEYRGRGIAQTTGLEAYQELFKLSGEDVVANPDLIIDPQHTLRFGVLDFVKICGCQPYAKAGDIIMTTKKLNGGLIGLADRQVQIAKWKAALL